MGSRADQDKERSAERAEAIPEIRPWCQVGWIFRDGEARAIERQDDRTKVRPAHVHDQRDE
jgi:hypothetical protein